jgi:CRP/FNR family cyclic AMP-dependent transcriptional regulator
MPTGDMIRRKTWDRAVHGRTRAADKIETSRRDLPAHGECASVSHKGRWRVDSVKGTTVLTSPKNHTIFSQGKVADAVFYIQDGRVKLTVVSPQGNEAVVAILEPGAFLGESCLAGQPVRTATAAALEDSTLMRLERDAMIRMLQEEPAFAERFLSYLLAHTMHIQADLVDQFFHSSEKRLARVLLSLAHLEKGGKLETSIPRLSEETFAEMIGTTRSRVSFFMNKFRRLGYIDYNTEIRVRSSLRNALLHD